MPGSELEKSKKTEEKAAPRKSRKQPVPRRAKWAIVLLSVLCAILLAALLEAIFLPSLIERDVNDLLRKMALDGVEFRIKTISLTSAEVACKFKDTTRGDRPLNAGSIGSLSIRYSPFRLLLERAFESLDVENCDIVADYSDGTVSFPVWEIFAEKFKSGETKEKENGSSATADDLNAVIPVMIRDISISGSLIAMARGEDSMDNLHIPYRVTVKPDAEQKWNKLDCSLMVHFATNGIRCKATYLHREKKATLDLDDFTLATSALPGTIRSGLPRGLRAGVSFRSKAEIDLNSLAMEDLENSSIEVEGDLTLGYRMPQGLRIDSAAPFSLKMVPRVIPTVKPMNPPKTEKILVFTLGGLKGKYDSIPFELDGIEASASLRHRTLQGGFRLAVADSEPAQFGFGGSMDDASMSFSLNLQNRPLLKAEYMGSDVSFRPDKLTAELEMSGGGKNIVGSFSLRELQADIDVGAFKPELKGMAASLRPEHVAGEFSMTGPQTDAELDISGGEIHAGYNGMEVTFKPQRLEASFKGESEKAISANLTGGELDFEKDGMAVSFLPESLHADAALTDGIEKASAELKGGRLLVELNGMACEAKTLEFNADSKDGRNYQADAKLGEFQFRQSAAGLTFEAPELCLNDASFDIDCGVLSGEVVCENSDLAMPELKLLVRDLRWELPFDYTIAKAEKDRVEDGESGQAAAPRTGKVSLGELKYDDIPAASLDGKLLWDDAAKALRLETDAHLFSIDGRLYAYVALGGSAGAEVVCGVDIPEQDADLSKDLAKFFPQFEDISCTGRLEGGAVYKILPKTVSGNARFRIADADVLIPEKKLEVRGVDLGFEIPELIAMKSAPGQTLSFQSLKFDKIETGAGRFAFRMEAPDTWQLENAQLDWCNGHIRLGGITYRMGQTTTEAVLYCDRLELPVFLTQIGLGKIDGSGAINGTIPVVITQKSGQALPSNIYFEDAFLFSTPGEDGTIKGEIDDAIMNGENGIEMELAKDALKDFSYSWVRMSMASTGENKENLKLSLQLDGRPNRALYYAFDENTASFIKSDTPCVFQGIRLDTNVNMYGKAMELVDYFQKVLSNAE